MKTFSKIALVTIAVAGVTACDPYTEENKGPPAVLSVLGVVGNVADGAADGASSSLEATSGTVAGAPGWVVGPIPSGYTVLMVKTNKLLDGATIQAAPDSCAPAGNWLTVNGAAPAAGTWQTCYSPSSPAASEGASIVIYPGANPIGGPTGSGWFVNAAFTPGIYVLGGSVKDKQGQALPIEIQAFVADAPAVAMSTDATPVAIETDTSIDVAWYVTAQNVTSQELQKKAADGTWTTVATATTTDPGAYHDAGLTPGNEYDYRVKYVNASVPGDFISPEAALWTLPTAPAKPTAVKKPADTVSTTPYVAVAWTKSNGAVSYDVQRAPESTTTPGTPGTYTTIAKAQTVDASGNGTYNDTSTSLTAGKNYFYRVVANSEGSTTSKSPDSDAVAF